MENLNWTHTDESHLIRASARLSMVALMSTIYNSEDVYDTIAEAYIDAGKSRSITLYRVDYIERKVTCTRNYYHHRLGSGEMPDEGSYLAKEKTLGPVYSFDEPGLQAHIVKTAEPVIIVGGVTPTLPYYFSIDDTFIRPLLDNPAAFENKVSYFMPLLNSDPSMRGRSVVAIVGGACSLQYAETASDWWNACNLLHNLTMIALMGRGGLRPSLTGRERQVLEYIKQGNTSQETADQLGLSVNTIFSHRTRLAKKLDVTIQELDDVIKNQNF